jgi:adenylylsulfate kinase
MVDAPRRLEPAVLWFTGLSGAGKSTIAREVCERLSTVGVPVEYLDGDTIRDIFPNTGFSRAERDAHVRRVGFLASRLEHHGIFVVCALISPYRESRMSVRRLCRRFVEIYVSTPLHECERRDVKGLYGRARRGEITNFTGLDDPYEPPVDPELQIDTSAVSLSEATDLVMGVLEGVDSYAGPASAGRQVRM